LELELELQLHQSAVFVENRVSGDKLIPLSNFVTVEQQSRHFRLNPCRGGGHLIPCNLPTLFTGIFGTFQPVPTHLWPYAFYPVAAQWAT
jgi:hypothetical protein